ncbi:AAA family ATPase [bacterium]|nr:AAA family ATPase [bacterium]
MARKTKSSDSDPKPGTPAKEEIRETSREASPDQANVVCQVVRDKDLKAAGRIMLRWSEKGGFFPAYSIKADKLALAVSNVRAAILKVVDLYADEKYVDDHETPEFQDLLASACAELAVTGRRLHAAIFASEDKPETADTVSLWLDGLTARNMVETLEIFVEDHCDDAETGTLTSIPWNLVLSDVDRTDPGRLKTQDELKQEFAASLADPEDSELARVWLPFWGVRHDIACVRNVDPLKRNSRIDPAGLSVLMVLDPDTTEDAEEALRKFQAKKEARPGSRKAPKAESWAKTLKTYDLLAKELQKANATVLIARNKQELSDHLNTYGRPDILYWLSHAAPEELKLGDDLLKMQDVRDLFDDVPLKAKKGTIAFFNGCRTAIEAKEGSFLRSFTDRDLFVGVIGTENETINVYAYKIGLDFLKRFVVEGAHAGPLLRDIRCNTLPLGLLYGSYCPSRVCVAPPDESKLAESTPPLFFDKEMFGYGLKLSTGVSEAVRELESEPAHSPVQSEPAQPPEPLAWPEKPYPSLGFYTLKDQALFLGRDEDSARLAELIDTPATRVLLLHGTSGSGKSSVIRAGLVPYLEKYAVGYRFPRRPQSAGMGDTEQLHLFFRPSDNFAARLAADLLEFTKHDYDLAPRPDGTPQPPVALKPILARCVDPQSSDVSLAELQAALDDPKRPDLLREILDAFTAAIPEKLVVTIDQAEELYTLGQGDTPAEIQRAEDRRKQAFAQLRGCLRGSGRWKVILSYRTEYHGRITDGIRSGLRKTPGLVDYLITDLNKAQLRQVIERPTLDFPVVEGLEPPRQKYGFTYDPGVIDAIVDGIFRLRGRNTDSVLPIAQVVCTRLYEKARVKTRDPIVAVIRHRDLASLQSEVPRQIVPVEAAPEDIDLAELENMPWFFRNWLMRRRETLARRSAESRKSDTEGLVLELLEDFADDSITVISDRNRSIKSALKSLMMRLYLTQPDGTLTSAQLDRKVATDRFWPGSPASFERILSKAKDANLLRFESCTGAHETQEATIRLGHDTLCKVVGRWDAAERAKRRIRKILIGSIATAAIFGCIVILDSKVRVQGIIAGQERLIAKNARHKIIELTKKAIDTPGFQNNADIRYDFLTQSRGMFHETLPTDISDRNSPLIRRFQADLLKWTGEAQDENTKPGIDEKSKNRAAQESKDAINKLQLAKKTYQELLKLNPEARGADLNLKPNELNSLICDVDHRIGSISLLRLNSYDEAIEYFERSESSRKSLIDQSIGDERKKQIIKRARSILNVGIAKYRRHSEPQNQNPIRPFGDDVNNALFAEVIRYLDDAENLIREATNMPSTPSLHSEAIGETGRIVYNRGVLLLDQARSDRFKDSYERKRKLDEYVKIFKKAVNLLEESLKAYDTDNSATSPTPTAHLQILTWCYWKLADIASEKDRDYAEFKRLSMEGNKSLMEIHKRNPVAASFTINAVEREKYQNIGLWPLVVEPRIERKSIHDIVDMIMLLLNIADPNSLSTLDPTTLSKSNGEITDRYLVLNTLGVAMYRYGDFGSAKKILEKTSNVKTPHMSDFTILALAEKKLGNDPEADLAYQKARLRYDDILKELKRIPDKDQMRNNANQYKEELNFWYELQAGFHGPLPDDAFQPLTP